MIEIYNEKQYAENMIKNGFIDAKRGQALYILAKYYKISEQLDKKSVKEKLVEFCKVHIDNYEYTDYYKTINTCVNNCFKKDNLLLEINNIKIMKSEIDYIQSLDIDTELRQALFTLLCLLRLNQQTVVVDMYNNKVDYGKNGINIKKFGNFKTKSKITSDILHRLYSLKLIDLAYGSTKTKLLFLDNIKYYNDEEEITYEITDLNNFGLWYEKNVLHNNKIIECVCCGKLIKRKSNRQLMCSECAEESIKEYDRQRKSENSVFREC